MIILKWLDIANGTNEMEKFSPKYKEWVNEKYSQNIESSTEHYNKQMNALIEIREKSR